MESEIIAPNPVCSNCELVKTQTQNNLLKDLPLVAPDPVQEGKVQYTWTGHHNQLLIPC